MPNKIRADYFFAASLFRSRDNFCHLDGIYVEPMDGGGVAIMAHDGYMASILVDEEGEVQYPMVFRVSKPLLSVCRKRRITGRGSLYVTVRDNRLCVVDFLGDEVHVQAGPATYRDAQFSSVARFFAKYGSLEQSGNPILPTRSTATILDAVKYLGGDGGLAVNATGDNGAMICRATGLSDFAAVVMPVVVTPGSYSQSAKCVGRRPEWLNAIPRAQVVPNA